MSTARYEAEVEKWLVSDDDDVPVGEFGIPSVHQLDLNDLDRHGLLPKMHIAQIHTRMHSRIGDGDVDGDEALQLTTEDGTLTSVAELPTEETEKDLDEDML